MNNILITKRIFLKKIVRIILLVIVAFKLKIFSANSAPIPEIILANRKKVTPSISSLNKPVFFPLTNNLRRKSGSPFLAKGYFLSVEGYVTDLIDIPIENVRIKIWQANHFGYYQHSVDPEDIDKFDQDFLGCGKVITDNFGYYSFLTIDPGFYGNRAPHIHFILQHDSFNDGKEFETQMFFPDHPFNEKDPKYILLNKKDRALLTCTLEPIDSSNPISAKRALFNFKLDIIHPVKRY